MNVSIGSQPNCSEATIRIDLRGEDKKKIAELIKKLDLELNNDSWTKNEGWDDDKEFDWSEGYTREKTIFGTPILEIDGDAPYNFGEEIEKVIKRYLPEARLEWSE